jgi:pSer/pThr/pTyr-binding forkhead associated (FHA) protein
MSSTEPGTVISEQHFKLGHGASLGNNAVLVVLSPREFGKARVVEQPLMTVGRRLRSGLRLQDPLVSLDHFRVAFDRGRGFSIEDTGSTNGTFVNNRRIDRPTQLQYGDRIVVGNTVLRFYLEEALEVK